MSRYYQTNQTRRQILLNILLAIVSLIANAFGIYLTINANIGVGPWDVLSIGLSKTFGILYGSASIAVSLVILLIDIRLGEAIGIAMFIDAFLVGKSVDFFQKLNLVPPRTTLAGGLVVMVVGLFVLGYTQFLYMRASLGCGPRDTLMVGLARKLSKIPIGAVSIAILSLATGIGYLLGGPVGVGTLACAFGAGPIMQFAFRTVRFDATSIRHQNIRDSWSVFCGRQGDQYEAVNTPGKEGDDRR